MKPKRIVFTLLKETPGTFRYEECGKRKLNHVGSLYLRKAQLDEGESPPKDLVVVIVDPADASTETHDDLVDEHA